MAERDVPGEFDYLFDDPTDVDQPGSGTGSFDAFDSSTWYFEPAPPPWYRTRQAVTALVAVAAASVALVVSGVLLVFRGPGGAVDEVTSVTPSGPSTAVSTRLVTSAEPSPPPPPPPETSAEPVAPPPVQTAEPRRPSTRTTRKEPEIGVTRTPETRSPISVAPQRPGGRDASRE